MPNPVPVVYDGVAYSSMKDCCFVIGVRYNSFMAWCSRQNKKPMESLKEYSTLCRSAPRWSESELEVLKKYYVEEGADIVKRLPGRSVDTIRMKANALGLYLRGPRSDGDAADRVPWTARELDILREYYIAEGVKVCKRLPNRTKHAVLATAARLRLFIRRGLRWDEEEEALLADVWSTATKSQLHSLFPSRSYASVRHKAQDMGLFRDNNDSLIQRVYNREDVGTCELIAEGLIRLRCSVCGSVCIVPSGIALSFEHGPMCEKYLWEEVADGE